MTLKLVDQISNGFPLCLQVEEAGTIYRDSDGWGSRHNATIRAYASPSTGINPSAKERCLLELIAALHTAVSAHNPDVYMAEHVVYPMVQVIGNVMNLDVGRLDPGRGLLDSYVSDLVTEWGMDPETGALNDNAKP